MLNNIINNIVDEFNNYLKPLVGFDQQILLMAGDISKHEKQEDIGEHNTIQNNLVLTLVNIEEENTLRNNFPQFEENGRYIQYQPKLHLNLYLLFSANFERYDEGLKHISFVLQFFQIHQKLVLTDTVTNSKYFLYFNLQNTGFEQLNNLWMVLGSKYILSVLYKARIVVIQESPAKGGLSIVEVQDTEKQN